ncbi:hypothetical protein WP1_090 [Pseudomonas phage WP1]
MDSAPSIKLICPPSVVGWQVGDMTKPFGGR